jgi:hypothetical protein
MAVATAMDNRYSRVGVVDVEHALGTTTIPAPPTRIVALSFEEDVLSQVGVRTVGHADNSYAPGTPYPWQEGEVDFTGSVALGGLAGKTFGSVYHHDTGRFAVDTNPDGQTAMLLGRLGMVMSPRIVAEVADRSLGAERVGLIDADLVSLGFASDALRGAANRAGAGGGDLTQPATAPAGRKRR